MQPEAIVLAAEAGAVGAAAAVVALGLYVSPRPPMRLDVEAIALRGQGVPLAACFTLLGRWYSITLLLAIAFAINLSLHREPWALLAIALVQLGSQSLGGALKHAFHRLRPDHWIVWREADTSYPSGHATTATAFYLALFLLAWHATGLPNEMRGLALGFCAACTLGLPWSRLALGAHYLSDVAGGLLSGFAWLCALVALAELTGLKFL